MFSRKLLGCIAKHDSDLFGGCSEWPESLYGRNASGNYVRRETLRPLPSDLQTGIVLEEDDGPNAYVVAYRDGKIIFEDKERAPDLFD